MKTLCKKYLSGISTAAKNINNKIQVIIDYRVDRCPLMFISAIFLARSYPMVLWGKVFNLHNALNDRFAEHDVAGITGRICTTFRKLWKLRTSILWNLATQEKLSLSGVSL